MTALAVGKNMEREKKDSCIPGKWRRLATLLLYPCQNSTVYSGIITFLLLSLLDCFADNFVIKAWSL